MIWAKWIIVLAPKPDQILNVIKANFLLFGSGNKIGAYKDLRVSFAAYIAHSGPIFSDIPAIQLN